MQDLQTRPHSELCETSQDLSTARTHKDSEEEKFPYIILSLYRTPDQEPEPDGKSRNTQLTFH